MNKIKAGIISGAGYTAGELLRLLLNHPGVEIDYVHSKSNSGRKIYEVHEDLFGDTDLSFSDTFHSTVDVIFLCVGHGDAQDLVPQLQGSAKIIDLSQDFRLAAEGNHFVYGLPEMNRAKIKQAQHIANPGCFATAIQLALLPLAEHDLLHSDVYINCTTGSTGAGQSLSDTAHFSWRQNNLSVYKAFTHQHLAEIKQSLGTLQPDFQHSLTIIPQRGSFTRGILACIQTSCTLPLEDLRRLYEEKYIDHSFVFVSENNVHLKQVVNTNKCLLYLEKHGDQLLIVSVIDNLLKGASGQAVQNMNLLFGLEETTGLRLKASAF